MQLTPDQSQLVAANEHAARAAARRFAGKGREFEDLAQEAMLALCEAALRFRPDAHPGVLFSQFARKRMLGRLIRATSVPRPAPLGFDPIDPASDTGDPGERWHADLWAGLEQLDSFEQLLIRRRYGLAEPPRTIEQLAEAYGRTPRYIRCRIERARHRLRGFLEWHEVEPRASDRETARAAIA